jgi:hypothetical protein
MLDLIREGKAPQSLVRRAARGELALAPAEAIEILALLAGDNEVSSQHANQGYAGDPDVSGEAEQTLRSWDEAAIIEAASAAETPLSVLRCLIRTQAERPWVIDALCGNPALSAEELEYAARQAGPAMLEAMASSERVRNSPGLLARIQQIAAADREPAANASGDEAGASAHFYAGQAAFVSQHPVDLPDNEDDRPFELVTDAENEPDPLAELLQRAKEGEAGARPEDNVQLSLLQRLMKMGVGERMKVASRGGREERMVLIRDRSKLVSLAVLASPKVDSSEMETYAGMKNVQESVLRAVAANRKNLKSYGVVRALVSNPKAPLDVSLPLMSHLQIKDLRVLSMNKNVNDTIRKRASRMFKIKTEEQKS